MPNPRGTADFRHYIVLHGWLMYFSFGLLFPLGALCARLMQQARKSKDGRTKGAMAILYQLHLWSESIGAVIMAVGVVSGFAQLGISSTHTHQRVGYTLWIMIWFQVVAAFMLRPPLGSIERGVWYGAHWLMGTAVIILGLYNMYSGIAIWEKVFPTRRLFGLNVAFSVQIAIMAFLYFATDRWENFLLQIKKRDAGILPDNSDPEVGKKPVQPVLLDTFN